MSEINVPFTPEHSAPDNPNQTQPPGYNPDPDEKKTLQLVDKLYSKAKAYRKRYDQKWIDFYKDFRGRQWKETRPSYRHSEVINLIFQTIQSMVPIMTDARPKLEYMATQANDPSQEELAEILSQVAENDWIQNNWLLTLTEIIYDSHLYGTSFGHVGYDPKANLGIGNILFESSDLFYLFPDPEARDINGPRTEYFIEAVPTSISKLKKDYPDKGKFISADVMDFAQGDKADIYQVMFKSPVDSKLIVEGPSGYDSIAKNQALKMTVYFKDDAYEEEEELELKEDGTPDLDDTTGEPKKKFVQKLKYPNGRKIVVAGGVLLEDGPMEFEDGKYPFCRLLNYILPREFWGVGEVENLEGPQKTFNKMVSFALDVLTLMGNPIWKVGTQAGIDTDNLFNKPGLVIECDDISQVQREPGVELQPYVLQMIDRFKNYIDGISGETDLSRGAEPQDVTAASAIQDLQEAQQTRLRLKSRNLDAFFNDFGKMYLARVFQYYNLPRIVRVSGDDGAQSFFHFHIENFDKPDGSQGKKAIISSPGADGMLETKEIEITADFDVRVATGSSLPYAKQTKQTMSFDLFKLGVIDDEELLKNLDYPNYEAVLQRVQQKKALMAQQQQMAQGGGGPPPGPPAGPPRAA